MVYSSGNIHILILSPKTEFLPKGWTTEKRIESDNKHWKKILKARSHISVLFWTYDNNTSSSETSFVDFCCVTGSNAKGPSRWYRIKKKFVSAFKRNEKLRDQPDVSSMSQDFPLEGTINATGKGTPALIFLNYCYTFFLYKQPSC